MQFSIRTPQEILFTGKVHRVSLPGKMGSFSILPLHAPLVSDLIAGKITYYTEEGACTLGIKGGLVTVQDNCIQVFLPKIQLDKH